MPRKLPVFLALVCVGALLSAAAAYAAFTASVSAAQSVSTQTLQPPTNVVATLTSQCKANKAQQVTVTWTGSASAFATGYTVQRDGTTIATVSSATTSYIDNAVAHTTQYIYTVLATYQQWSSGAAAPAVTTC